jgi:hypothetical protein
VIIKNNHFDKRADNNTLSVDIAGDGTFQSKATDSIGTHPPKEISVRGRIVGENLEADISMGYVCTMHLSMKKT